MIKLIRPSADPINAMNMGGVWPSVYNGAARSPREMSARTISPAR